MANQDSSEMQRATNWDQVVKNTIDQYDDPVHGVQKDAVQNGKDAIPDSEKNRNGTPKKEYVKDNWKFTFELTEITPKDDVPVKALIMTDYGTTGLTGEKRVDDFISDEDIPLEEKWARFESYAMANEGGQTLGARGQGKFVFVWASNQKKIIYDSQKANGKYRAGYTTVSGTRSPVYAYDGDAGKDWIRKNYGLEPVHSDGNTGSRIIIVDPNEALVNRLSSGDFLKHIEETWWPFIQDYNTHIEVIVDGITSIAKVPDIIQKIHDGNDSEEFKLWKKDGLKFKSGKGVGCEYTIRGFRIAAFTQGGIPDAFRGIAVFRGCMKVQAVQPLFGYDFEDKISGYVILDPEGDEKLREVEKPSHYEFKVLGIWKKLKTVIDEEAQKFGTDKLGIGISKTASPDEKRQAYVSKALQIFRFLSKDWPMNIAGQGPGPGPGPGPRPVIRKNIYVSIMDFVFPNPANVERLDWGESATGWWLKVGNRELKNKKLLLECAAFSLSGKKLLNFAKKEVVMVPESVFEFKGNGSGLALTARKDIFTSPGKYKIIATITDPKSKKILDEVVQNFWVEMDPPPHSPFDMQSAPFSEVLPEEVELEWKLEFHEDGIIVYYNIDHPSFIEASRNEAEAMFLGEVAGMAGLQLLIRNISTLPAEDGRLKKLPFEYNKLFGQDAVDRYLETIKMRDLIRHRILSNYLT